MFRARRVDAQRLIWVKSLKSRDRPWFNQSTIERLSLSSSNLQSWLAVGCTLGCFDQGPGYESEYIVVAKPPVSHDLFPRIT